MCRKKVALKSPMSSLAKDLWGKLSCSFRGNLQLSLKQHTCPGAQTAAAPLRETLPAVRRRCSGFHTQTLKCQHVLVFSISRLDAVLLLMPAAIFESCLVTKKKKKNIQVNSHFIT